LGWVDELGKGGEGKRGRGEERGEEGKVEAGHCKVG